MLVALTPLGSHECVKLHGVDRVQPDVVLNALSHFMRNAGTFTLAAVRKLS